MIKFELFILSCKLRSYLVKSLIVSTLVKKYMLDKKYSQRAGFVIIMVIRNNSLSL